MKSVSSQTFVRSITAVALVVCVLGLLQINADAQVVAPKATESVPVESSMHEFMEYFFQPTYIRLQKQMAAQPADSQGWKAIKSDSLILAEGGNLLLARLPEKDAQKWTELSVEVRQLAGDLYKAGKAKDFKLARQHYETMLTKCNACHQQFDKKNHQLKP